MAMKPYSSAQDEDQDPLKGVSDDPTAPSEQQPIQAYKPPTQPATPKPLDPTTPPTNQPADQPPKTFAQIQAQGEARPPAPTDQGQLAVSADQTLMNQMGTPSDMGGMAPNPGGVAVDSPYNIQPFNPASMDGDAGAMARPSMLPGDQGDMVGDAGLPAVPDELPAGIAGMDGDAGGMARPGQLPGVAPMDGDAPPIGTPGGIDQSALSDQRGSMVTDYVGDAPPRATPGAIAGDPTTANMAGGGIRTPDPLPTATDSLLPLLTGGATGDNQTDLQKLTAEKATEQLNNPSPYNTQAVRDEYDALAAPIDDQYATDSRNLDNSFASRGLYGSAGKDFHSGRLADLNVGKRTAKTALAADLANKYATTAGQYGSQAIAQGAQVGQQGSADRLAYLNALMGYGQQGFNNDLATADFNQRANESDQDFELRMLMAGYGA